MERPGVDRSLNLTVRHAAQSDAARLASLINTAYVVEAFFTIGDRTTAEEVTALMEEGRFLLLESGPDLAGAVYVEVRGDCGYFGMLSIHPSRQKQGLGARLMQAAEEECRRAGCRQMEIEVVNLRTELPPYYQSLGYAEQGTRPFPDADRSTRPCHFIVMRKPLADG